MKAEILCVGTELLLGDIVNTNAAYIAEKLAGIGIELYYQTVVGDNPKRLKKCIHEGFARADAIIMTGGLGPTYDDLTKETVAEYFGLPLEEDKDAMAELKHFFKNIGREMTENNKKQAMIPKGARALKNRRGTAPGIALEKDGKVAVLLPGPPGEMRPMFEESVVPLLKKYTDKVIVSHTVNIAVLGESNVAISLSKYCSKSALSFLPIFRKLTSLIPSCSSCCISVSYTAVFRVSKWCTQSNMEEICSDAVMLVFESRMSLSKSI